MNAWSAIHSHPRADIEGAMGELANLFGDALGQITYMTGGKTGEEMKMDDREAAIQRYKDYKARVLKDPDKPLVRPHVDKPQPASKHKKE